MHYSVICAYCLLHSYYMFQHYYIAIFQEDDIKYLFKKYSNKIGQNKHAYVLVSVAQKFTGFGSNYIHRRYIYIYMLLVKQIIIIIRFVYLSD